jgi:phage gpG-like protein
MVVNMSDLSEAMAKVINDSMKKLIAKEFANETSPWGHPWKPKKIPNGEKTLIDTRYMRRSFHYQATSASAKVTNSAPYFEHATVGTGRQVLPSGNTIPPMYAQQIKADLKKVLDKEIPKRLKFRK